MEARTAAELNEQGAHLAKDRKFKEAAELFLQAVQADARFGPAHRNLGHVHLELGHRDEAIGWYEKALKLEPRSVDSLNNLGMLRSQKKDYVGAIQVLAKAVQISPTYTPAFNNLGIALASANRHAEAVNVFRRALALQPSSPEANNNLGLSLVESGWPDQAIAFFERAIELKPDYADAHRNLGIALSDLGRFEEALKKYQQALELDPGSESSVRMNRAKVLMLQGDFAAGWQEYEHRLAKDENVRVRHDAPRWDGSPLAGRTLLLEAEQGLGDTIQFVRLGAAIKRHHDEKIILAVEPKLLALLAGVEGIDLIVPQDQPRPKFDVWSPLLSVPGLLGLTPGNMQVSGPYLNANAEKLATWQRELKWRPGIKIGIAWQGNPLNKADRGRSFSLHEFAPIGGLAGVTLISLQKGPGTDQLDESPDLQVVRLGREVDKGSALFDTAAIMKSLDLVITADTSLAHLAGALGVPVWVPLAQVPDWRWGLTGERTPWYPTMRLFRQEKLRDWPGVFQRMRQALLAEFPQLRPRSPEDYTLATSGFNRLAVTRHAPMLYNRLDSTIGRSLAELGEYSPSEVTVFNQVVRPGSTVVEAGASFGAHTVALAQQTGQTGLVHAFEPQRVLFQTLAGNVALASLTHVHCYQAAVGDKSGAIKVPSIDYSRPNHFAAVELGAHTEGETVPVVTIDSLGLSRCDLIKIDVNGMELPALRGARQTIERCRPVLYVASDRQQHAPAIIEWLMGQGYKLYWHVARLYDADNYYGNKENTFANMASLNILAIHNSVTTDIQGLPAIKGPQSDWRNP